MLIGFLIGVILILTAIAINKHKKFVTVNKLLEYAMLANGEEILKILYQIKAVYDDKRIITTTHDREIKDIVNHYIELYAEEQRKSQADNA